MHFLNLIFTAVIIFPFSVKSQSVAGRPNIIFIMTDDLGYADLSCYGRKDYRTPHLDKLAAEGLKFTHAYAAAPVCTPTRVALMTGRYPGRTPIGLLEPLVQKKRDSAYGLSPEFPSMARQMKLAGYETALIGKWHLGFLPEHTANSNGFDYFYGIKSGGADYISHRGDRGGHDLFENEQPVYTNGYLTELFSEKTEWFLKKAHSQPFFLSLQFNAPHWPWQGPGDRAYPDTGSLNTGGSPEIYAAMMKSLDDGIGKIMAALDETKLSENTLVIFTSDNGGEKFSDMGPFSGKKMTLWEGGIRVPAIARWPGKIKPGAITDQPVIIMDWTATILSLAGIKQQPGFSPDGKDLSSLLLTGLTNKKERTFYWRIFQRNQQQAVRSGNWKYLRTTDGEYLFDLVADPGERMDVKNQQPGIFRKLKKKYQRWDKSLLEPIPLN